MKNDEHTMGYRPRRSDSDRSTPVQAYSLERWDIRSSPKLEPVRETWEVFRTRVHVARRPMYVSTVVDCLSRRVLAIRIDSEAATIHVTALLVDAIDKYGPPGILWSDKSGFLVGEEFNRLILRKGICHRAFPAHRSRAPWPFLGSVPDVSDDSGRICPLTPLTS
jgi:transposase InsO family protein